MVPDGQRLRSLCRPPRTFTMWRIGKSILRKDDDRKDVASQILQSDASDVLRHVYLLHRDLFLGCLIFFPFSKLFSQPRRVPYSVSAALSGACSFSDNPRATSCMRTSWHMCEEEPSSFARPGGCASLNVYIHDHKSARLPVFKHNLRGHHLSFSLAEFYEPLCE